MGELNAQGDPKAGQQKAALCAGCHLPKGEGSGLNPALAGQTVEYFTHSMNAYKSGQRQHPGMNAIAKDLSDQDIADLAAFYHSLK
jgi:cytochrome c553